MDAVITILQITAVSLLAVLIYKIKQETKTMEELQASVSNLNQSVDALIAAYNAGKVDLAPITTAINSITAKITAALPAA